MRDLQQGWLDFWQSGKEEKDRFESKAENDRKVSGKMMKDAEDRTAFHIYIAKLSFEISISLA